MLIVKNVHEREQTWDIYLMKLMHKLHQQYSNHLFLPPVKLYKSWQMIGTEVRKWVKGMMFADISNKHFFPV